MSKITDGMHEAIGCEAERAVVVRWLREQAEQGLNRALYAKSAVARAGFGGGSLALSRAAVAIERGEHHERTGNEG